MTSLSRTASTRWTGDTLGRHTTVDVNGDTTVGTVRTVSVVFTVLSIEVVVRTGFVIVVLTDVDDRV